MSITVREMTIQDYDAARELWEQSEGVGLSPADSRENVAVFLSVNPGLSFVALEDGRLVGAVLCGSDGRRGFLYHLAVSPAARRRGTGSRLVESCLSRLHRNGMRKCHIFVMADNADGRKFWEKIGWVERMDLVVMSRDVTG
jgi:ribosomal protein S18 acetylase RimI-like enzyme